MSFFRFIFLIIIFFLFISCKEERTIDINHIQLKRTSPPRELYMWGVTKYSDLRLREVLSDDSPTLRFMTRGTLLEIVRRSDSVVNFDGKRDYWYLVKADGLTGWIFGSYIYIFNNMEDAERRCEEILFNTFERKNLESEL